MFFLSPKKVQMPTPDSALPGRETEMPVPSAHFVNKNPLKPPFPQGTELALFGLGCFWGAERLFWQTEGVFSTSVGYAAGYTPNPTYEEVCSGGTGHNEVVRVVYHPTAVSFASLLRVFWEGHDPTRGCARATMLARSTARASTFIRMPSARPRKLCVTVSGFPREGRIPQDYDGNYRGTRVLLRRGLSQQYLAKNPGGYCGLGGTGVSCPAGVGVAAE